MRVGEVLGDLCVRGVGPGGAVVVFFGLLWSPLLCVMVLEWPEGAVDLFWQILGRVSTDAQTGFEIVGIQLVVLGQVSAHVSSVMLI